MKVSRKLQILLQLLVLVKPLTGILLLAIFFGTMGFLTAQFIPILGGYAILSALGEPGAFTGQTIAIGLAICALTRAIFRFAEQRLNHYLAFTLLAILRDRVFKALRRLCPAKLAGREKGDLISLITSDVELLEVFYAHTLSPIGIALVVEGIMCLYIGSFHWSLGLLAFFAFITVGVILPAVIARRSGTLGAELRAESGRLAAQMLENIRGIDETLQYQSGAARLRDMVDKTNALAETQGRFNHLTGTNHALANTLILFFDTAMLALCTIQYLRGAVGLDGFLLPLLALMSSFGPVTALSALGTTLQSTVAAGERVLAILEETPETEEITGQPPIRFEGAATKNLSFSYGETPVLHDLSLSIPKGKITGIVGKSGCGKSTLLKLLMRFWRAEKGTILLSGRSIETINTADLRAMEGYMTQETQLFQDTIAENLRIGKASATQEELEAACKKAAIHARIQSLPKGYETPVGELGSTLSAGERQRLGLARAFLHDAPFLLLDEPTSNLDSLNEAIILKSLHESAKDKTILLVSHRPSTLCIADRIIAMDEGRISDARIDEKHTFGAAEQNAADRTPAHP